MSDLEVKVLEAKMIQTSYAVLRQLLHADFDRFKKNIPVALPVHLQNLLRTGTQTGCHDLMW